MADDKKKKDQQVADDEDPRLDFLLNYMIKSYRLKQDKWNKMIAIPENKVNIFTGRNKLINTNQFLNRK